MVATVRVDIIGEVDANERNGVVTRLVRLARVTGLSNTDPRVLTSALTACDGASPALTVGSTPTGYAANLILVERAAKLTDDKSVVDVTLTYEIDTRSQGLSGLAFGYLLAELNTNLVQATTYTDVNGNRTSVTHVYPTTSTHFQKPTGVAASLADRTQTKGIPVQYLKPQLELRVRQIKATRHPELIASAIAGKVNRHAWYGAQPREWLCTGVTIAPQSSSASPPTFELGFTFQRNPTDTWDPEAVFRNDWDSLAPSGTDGTIVEGVGTKRVQVHEDADFEAILEARVYNG